MSAKEIDTSDWARYMAAEERAFAEVRVEVTERLEPRAPHDGNRLLADSPIHPGRFARDWNRSYIVQPDAPPTGAVALLHGLTDSPCSLRQIAQRDMEAGYVAVAILRPAVFPAFAKAAWPGIVPECYPFKFNSFPVNGARRSSLAARALQRYIAHDAGEGRLGERAPVLTPVGGGLHRQHAGDRERPLVEPAVPGQYDRHLQWGPQPRLAGDRRRARTLLGRARLQTAVLPAEGHLADALGPASAAARVERTVDPPVAAGSRR
jgi:hypothetical protein